MTTPSPAPQSFEERLSRVRLWTLIPVVFVPLAALKYLTLRLGVSNDVFEKVGEVLLYGLVFGWWLLKVAPRPFSVQAAMGRPPNLAGWGLVAVALFGVTCLRILWWTHPYWTAIVKGSQQRQLFPNQ